MKKLACNESQRVNFAGSGENLPDIAKSRDASMDNKDFRSLLISVKDSDEAERTAFCFEPQVAMFNLRSSCKLHKGFHVI